MSTLNGLMQLVREANCAPGIEKKYMPSEPMLSIIPQYILPQTIIGFGPLLYNLSINNKCACALQYRLPDV